MLQVGQPRRPFKADLPNREVAEWFNYKSSGHTVSFVIPPSFESDFLGLALWVVYTCKASKEKPTYLRVVITNETDGTSENYPIYVHTVVSEAQSTIKCITGKGISMKSGDRFKVSFPSLLYYDFIFGNVPIEVKVNMCGVHVIQDRPSTSVH